MKMLIITITKTSQKMTITRDPRRVVLAFVFLAVLRLATKT